MNNRGRRSSPSADLCHTPLIPWGRTQTAADPDAAVIQRPPLPEPKLQGQSGRPGCAETDRTQRAQTRPQRPKTVVRWRRGRGPAKPGRETENAKNECVASGLIFSSIRVRRAGEQEADQVCFGASAWCETPSAPRRPTAFLSPLHIRSSLKMNNHGQWSSTSIRLPKCVTPP